MTEQNNGRPFAKGDMVVCKIDGVTQIGRIKRYDNYFAVSPLFVIFDGFELWVKRHEVKTIRKPRKGGKEGRDIVAMLGREYHKDMRWLLFNIKLRDNNKDDLIDYWDNRKNKDMSYISGNLYLKAKSMLGGDYDN